MKTVPVQTTALLISGIIPRNVGQQSIFDRARSVGGFPSSWQGWCCVQYLLWYVNPIGAPSFPRSLHLPPRIYPVRCKVLNRLSGLLEPLSHLRDQMFVPRQVPILTDVPGHVLHRSLVPHGCPIGVTPFGGEGVVRGVRFAQCVCRALIHVLVVELKTMEVKGREGAMTECTVSSRRWQQRAVSNFNIVPGSSKCTSYLTWFPL